MEFEIFKIQKCGFYKKSQHCFADLNDLLVTLNDWVGSRPNVAATATFQDLESIPEQVLCSCCVQIPAIGFGL
ncbi:MAG: hypothetical protein RBR97_19850, partial [Bacteroidales bacterium]|nr:hypothetical protein [Bacteroidales bacterium]